MKDKTDLSLFVTGAQARFKPGQTGSAEPAKHLARSMINPT